MSNDNTPENKDLDPVVQAVVNALNDRSKFEPSYIKQNLAEGMSIADRVKARQEKGKAEADAAEEKKAREYLANKGINGDRADEMIKKGIDKAALRAEKASMKEDVEPLSNEIIVDIYEENGQIVGIDNGAIFSADDLPGLDYLESYYGSKYIEDMINEAISSIELSEATKPVAKPKPAAKPVAKPKPAAKPVAKPVAKPAAKPVAKPAAKPVAKPAAGKKPTTGNTKVTPAKNTAKPSSDDLQPVKVTGKRTTPSDGLEPVKVTGKRTTPSDGLEPVKVTGKRTEPNKSASITPPRSTDEPASEPTGKKPGIVSRIGSFFNDNEVGQGLKKVAGDALIGGIGSKLTGGSFSQGAKAGAVGSLVGQTGIAAYDDATGRDDEEEGETQANQGDMPQGRTSSGSGSVPVRYSIDGRNVDKGEYQSQRAGLDQDVVFNVKNTKTGEKRSIRKGDPEFAEYEGRYKKMKSVVQEALIRLGAVITEEGWMLDGELLKSVYTEVNPGVVESPYYYDSTGRLKIMTESEWVNLSLAEAVVERAIAEAMDEVGEEDEDVDNDGDSDSSDDYLSKRRKAIGDAIKGKK